MGADIIPYDPYHPHLGYTLVVTCLAWFSGGLYSRFWLQRSPHTRTMLFALAIVLPIYAEATAYLIDQIRPAPNTPVGYVLSHFHAYVVQRFPIDSFLSPTVETIAMIVLAGLMVVSIARFLYGTFQLNQLVASAAPIAHTEHAALADDLAAINATHAQRVPQILVVSIEAPLAFTTGLLHPQIYITRRLLQLLTHDEVMAVLCHEWAHVMRRDNLWNWMVRLLRDIAWFLPGSHVAWRWMVSSQDEACDALAARMTHQPLALARALVKIASAWNETIPALQTVSSFAYTHTTPRVRVEQMIWMSDNTTTVRRSFVVGAYMLAGLLLLLAPLPALVGS